MKTFICRELRHAESAKAFIDANWQAMAGTKHPLQVDFKPETKKRSTAALRRYWAILRQIESDAWVEGRQYAADPVWDDFFKRKFIGVVDGPCGMTSAMHSSELSDAEFSEYVSRVEAFAATDLGITIIEDIEPQGRP